MKLFSTLALEITSDCNRRCTFCPVAYAKRPREEMPLEHVEAAASELAALNFRGRVEFYIYNEPLRNRPALHAALDAFQTRCPKATLMVASNGDFVRGVEDLRELFDRGLQQLVLNAYSLKQVPKYQAWAQELGCKSDDVYRPLPRGVRAVRVYDKSSPDKFGTGVFALQNRSGNAPGFRAPVAKPVARMCVKPFRLLNINWKGEGLVCCNDYHGDVVVGRFPQQSLASIWNSPVLNAYRQRLAQRDRSLPLCRSCDCHAGAYPGNVERPAGAVASGEHIEAAFTQRVAARKNLVQLKAPA